MVLEIEGSCAWLLGRVGGALVQGMAVRVLDLVGGS